MLSDADLRSRQEARDKVRKSAEAQQRFAAYDQDRVDRVCRAIVDGVRSQAERLGRMAVVEAGFGDPRSKARKTLFASVDLWESIEDLQTVGIVHRDDERRVYELAEPYGVVLGIIPCTNPTSTAIFKILIAVKTRNSIVLSPHPRSVKSIAETARIARDAAVRAGAPADLIQCLDLPTMEGTQEAMRHRKTALILATGGPGLVRAAYSAGKPAIGVGPGNTPAYIDRSADVENAVEAIVQSQVFDNSTICSSEQSVVVDRPRDAAVRAAFQARGAHWCDAEQTAGVARIVVQGRALNPAIVGLYPWQLAEMAGFTVPRDTTVLIAPAEGVGWEHPLSIEKLAPILAYYTVDGWREGCQRCKEVLNFGGRGHTVVVHAEDEEVVWAFAHEKPTHRILANAPAAQGAVGYATGLRPSMTLGCGSFGGNISSENISAEHLMLRKRLAWVKPGFVEEEARRRGVRRVASPPASPAASAGAAAAGPLAKAAPATPEPLGRRPRPQPPR